MFTVAVAGPKWDEEDPNSEFRSAPLYPPGYSSTYTKIILVYNVY